MNPKVQIDFAFWNTMETERLQKSAQMSKRLYGKYSDRVVMDHVHNSTFMQVVEFVSTLRQFHNTTINLC